MTHQSRRHGSIDQARRRIEYTHSPMIDLERARRETPGCEHVLHFNNAGAGLAPEPVLAAQIAHLALEARIGSYEAEIQQASAIDHAYDAVASLLGAARDEIAIVDSATRAWDAAFYAIPFKPGDRIVTATAEYAANYIAFLQVARRTGAEIVVVPDDEHGQISIEALRALVDERVKLIAITHAPTNGGLVNPAAEVGKIARQAGVLYLLDACQSAGQLDLDVAAIGCDFLSATGRKYLRGPRGTGFLYVRRAVCEQIEPMVLDLHAAHWTARDRFVIRPDARRFETGEASCAARIGLGVAVDYALGFGLEAITARIAELSARLRRTLAEIPGVTGRDRGVVRSGIVSFTLEGHEPSAVVTSLRAQRINAWTSGLSSTRLDMEARGIASIVRASVHYYNTEAEVDRFCAALRDLVG
jgi:cysteine desulfurase/selenocysteine lyase